MTTVATCRLVGAPQIEVRESVIERFPVELDDVGISPLVIRVAMLAIPFRSVGLTPVKSLSQTAVSGDLLVTRKTETGLRLAGKRLMALSTFLLELGVPPDQGTRHHQRLQYVLGFCCPMCRNHHNDADRKGPWGVTVQY